MNGLYLVAAARLHLRAHDESDFLQRCSEALAFVPAMASEIDMALGPITFTYLPRGS
jgi:hypothetical protein